MVTEIPCITNKDRAVFRAPKGKGNRAIFITPIDLKSIYSKFVSSKKVLKSFFFKLLNRTFRTL